MIFDALVFGHLRRDGMRAVITVLSIAIAVAIALALDVAGRSAATSLLSATDSVTTDVDLQVVSTRERIGFDEMRFVAVRSLAGVRDAWPTTIDALAIDGETLRIRGVDLLATLPRGIDPRERVPGPFVRDASIPTAKFVGRPGVFVSERIAHEHNLRVGSRLRGASRGHRVTLEVVGVLRAIGNGFDSSDALVDLSTSQTRFDRGATLDRIDISIDPASHDAVTRGIAAMHIPQTRIVEPQTHPRQLAAFLGSFTRDLTIFGLFAILLGCGAIANGLAISVARRANEIGTLRTLGVTRAAIFRTYVAEGALFGAIGSLAGLGVGQALAMLLVPHLLARVDGVSFDLVAITRVFAIGTSGATLAAVVPAWRAARIAPARAMRLRGAEQPRKIALPYGFSRTPVALFLAACHLGATPFRTLVVIAALATAVATTAGIVTFADSFATSVANWATRVFPGDFSIDLVRDSRTPSSRPTPSPMQLSVDALPGVARVVATPDALTIEATPHAHTSMLRRNLEHLAGKGAVHANRDLREALLGRLGAAVEGAYALVALASVTALATIATAMFALVLERRREIGMLRTLGATTRQIAQMIVFEASIIGAIGAAIGIAAGIALAITMLATADVRAFAWTLDIHVPIFSLTLIGIVTVLLAAGSGAIPARLAAKVRATDAGAPG